MVEIEGHAVSMWVPLLAMFSLILISVVSYSFSEFRTRIDGDSSVTSVIALIFIEVLGVNFGFAESNRSSAGSLLILIGIIVTIAGIANVIRRRRAGKIPQHAWIAVQGLVLFAMGFIFLP